MALAEYKVYVDWSNGDNLTIGDFEASTENWLPYGEVKPYLSVSTERSVSGRSSLAIVWPSGATGDVPVSNWFQFGTVDAGFGDGAFASSLNPSPELDFGPPAIVKTIRRLIPGTTYEFTAHVYTEGISTPVVFKVDTGDESSPTSTEDEWEEVSFSFTATETTHVIWMETENIPAGYPEGTVIDVVDDSTTTSYATINTDDLDEEVQAGIIFKMYTSGGVEKEPTHFTITSVEADNGTTNIFYTPVTEVPVVTGDQIRFWIPDRHWMDDVTLLSGLEDISEYVMGRPISYKQGRDDARSLSAIAPSDTGIELVNTDRRFTPGNPDTPYGERNLRPGRPILIRANFEGHTYNQFRGYLDEYSISADIQDRVAKITAIDLLGRMAEFPLSTTLYPSIQTGQALNVILDAMGWPSWRRDVDSGATTMRWWCEEDTDALTALDNIVASEGLGAFAYIDPYGNFVFKDRHHRLRMPNSLNLQESYSGEIDGPEPQVSLPFTMDIGWKDLFNTVDMVVQERSPLPVDSIWDEESTLTIPAGQTLVTSIITDDPFFGAIPPVAGTDFELLSGTVSSHLSRTSGRSLDIHLTAGGSNAIVTNLRVRGILVPVRREYRVKIQDTDSVDENGARAYDRGMPYAGIHDVESIAEIILGHRAERIPIIHFTVNNDNPTRLTSLLNRRLSDRIHITEPETFTDADFFVENITHDIMSAGTYHSAEIGAERVTTQVDNVFTFDDPERGFDLGIFGRRGLDNPDTLFILGQSLLGEGQLGH